jgi:ligand-binding sensor protein
MERKHTEPKQQQSCKPEEQTGKTGMSKGRGETSLSIPDFCDTKLFEQLLHNWATATGLATVAIGSDGKYVSGYYNFTDFCENLTRKSPEGLRRCIECDKKGRGVYLCHAGLVDFATAITLEDGTVLGNILGGQVLPQRPDESKFRATARELQVDEDAYLEALRRVNVRTPAQIKAAAKLLAAVVNMFVRTSYAARQSAKKLSVRGDIITSLSKIYFCDYYLDLETGSFLELDATPNLHAFVGHGGSVGKMLVASGRKFVDENYLQEFLHFTDLTTLAARIGNKHSIVCEFITKPLGWCRGTFIVAGRDATGKVCQVIYAVQDIHEEKARELKNLQLLQQAAAAAEHANRVKSDFLARMSHDMRTPLTTIIGLSDLGTAKYQDPELRTYFATIKR